MEINKFKLKLNNLGNIQKIVTKTIKKNHFRHKNEISYFFNLVFAIFAVFFV